MASSKNKNKTTLAADPDFEDLVLPAELKAISARSSAATRGEQSPAGLPDYDQFVADGDRSAFLERTFELLREDDQDELWNEYAEADPDRRHAGLTGLALSGGGIRSASVNLGIVQVLHRIGLFKCFDYMSTVSGGGYLGGSISACLASDASRDGDVLEPESMSPADELQELEQKFPYKHEPGKPENAAFRHIRNFSKFLVPHGKVDYVRLPVLLLRGIAVNFLVILPWILGLALVSHWLMNADGQWFWTSRIPLPTQNPFAVTLLIAGLFLVLILLFPIGRVVRTVPIQVFEAKRFRDNYERAMAVTLIAALAFAWIEVQPILLDLLGKIESVSIAEIASTLAGSSALLASLSHLLARNLSSILNRFGLYVVALLGFAAFWSLYLLLLTWLNASAPPEWWPAALRQSPDFYVLVLLAGLFLYTSLFVDANGLSLHNFYRDRISDAFVFCRDQEKDRVDNTIDPKLSELAGSRIGPFHLVNTTLNTREFPENFRKGRHGEPFLLSPVHFGSRITGYDSIEKLEDAQKEVRLSTAIATSGAAVSSNMGTQTSPALRLILSVLNIRLGYWLVNPMATWKHDKGNWPFWLGRRIRAGVVRYLQEFTGLVGFKTSYIYLSDGGHIENLGLYELVRRQCRFIVVGDGECDTKYNFKGLTDALRLIRMDFGIVVEMDGLDEIRSGEQQHARGTIYYPDGRIGYLVYLKSSLLGDDMVEATVSDDAYVSSPLRSDVRRFDELTYMAHYKARHPDFPHETTADQFFDEVQFEAYRALGYLIAERTLTKEAY
ncbi:MAG: hypothetical protein QNJ14_10025 [Woeseiaceae bacterium]|nr:hypothetical protein [Woeseiaceae bacterium]